MNKTEEVKPSFVYEGQEYYNRRNAAKYVGMTDAGLRLRIQTIERRNNIVFPMTTFPGSVDTRNSKAGIYISGKILDVLRKPVLIGKEQEWIEKLKNVIEEAQQA